MIAAFVDELVTEIPARAHRVKVLTVSDLPDGTSTVQVIGTGTGSYTFTSAFTAKDGSAADPSS